MKRFDFGVSKVEDVLASGGGLIVAFMMFYVVAQVIARAAKNPIDGGTEYLTLIFVWVVMLGISYAFRKGEHLAMGVVYDRISAGARRYVNIVLLCIALFIIFMLVWSMTVNTMWALNMGDTIVGAIKVQTWPARLGMPLGIAPAFFRAIVLLVQTVRGG